ncbi:DUF2993 domain-containing protein [cf. Phormidesmis sp. LEGE 11477]|uniref:LmeA family phospholipid-binding protein n=1 Tax=cf. Phormidesmis sp. LEGE 11477 TaxID=1828680 RepID=UPI00187E808F|nr:DUF2993 domain-containing protein [cf. Phormidesmis sp. LEGE 11477]MBE9062832.1 DUF2993 domain-containing protein [cf. Phormidesmis sp. LEGE 11477]
MEIVTVLLSSLLLLISPAGIVLDQAAENAIRDRLAAAESLAVRIDNGPSYQLLQGKVDKVRIAGRGISPIPGLRFEVAELETDPIDLAFQALRQGEVVLDKPFQGAARIVLTEADVNAFLRSPFVAQQLENLDLGNFAANPAQAREGTRYQINNLAVDFLPSEESTDGEAGAEENRLRISAELEDLVEEAGFVIEAEAGLSVAGGDRLKLISPTVVVDGTPVDPRLVNVLLGGLNDRLSLQQFDESGVVARVVDFDVGAEALDIALWVRVDPSFTAPAAQPGSIE